MFVYSVPRCVCCCVGAEVQVDNIKLFTPPGVASSCVFQLVEMKVDAFHQAIRIEPTEPAQLQ